VSTEAAGEVNPHETTEPEATGADAGISATAETPVEALPPISGGAPEQASETESASTDADSESESESEPVAESATPTPGDVARSEPEAEVAATSAPEPPSAETEAAVPEAAEGTAPEVAEGTAPEAPVEAGTPPAVAEAVVSPPVVEPTAAEAAGAEAAPAPPAAPPKSGSSPGKPARSEPRPQRPRPAPVPPKPHPADALLARLAYVIVNEAGASVYSTSPVGREEFPDFDATLRSTISIGRRLQDPLAELVKIEPQSIGVGLYQHDVNAKQLKESLDGVISSCVNFVGVDLNTASVPLLRHVSGLNQLTARRVLDYRKEKGPFRDRQQLLEVEGVGPATFTQAAGFLKLREGDNPLDRTWVHPESYGVATRLLEKLGFSPDVVRDKEQLPSLHAKLDELDIAATAREMEVGEPTLRDICEALARPERDPRDDLPKPIFKKGVLKLEDLQPGMELKGTVLNVVDFGAFVDIGLKDSGLVHISQLANRYIKSPHDVVSVGDVVTAWVMGVDHERKRVSLTMVKPGTERPRGGPGAGGGGGGGGGGRRSAGEPRGERRPAGSGAPATGRPPRREGGPPPGGPGGGPGGGEAPARRHEPATGRGPGGPRPGGGPPGRGGPGGGSRPPQTTAGPGRFERAQAPRPQPRPSKPAPPPPPLSKDALAGSVPLRTFGQLKQLWQARTSDDPGESPPGPAEPAAPEPAPQPPKPEAPAPEQPSNEGQGTS
jgi:uncharacterized protein